MRAIVNGAFRPAEVEQASGDAMRFHSALPGYRPTPVRQLPALAAELGIASVAVKDESDRLGLPAFKVLGASWAIECGLREQPDTHTLVAASAGNHGRAVARVAAERGLSCRVYLPARAATRRRQAIAAEGADLVVVDGTYEEAVDRAGEDGARQGVLEIADVGSSAPASWVIDGYATLFAEAFVQAAFDLVLVPVGVGSLAAAAVRFAAPSGISVVGVEPANAMCLTASLAAGEPTVVATPGTTMAGMDCAQVSSAAWPSLRHGIQGMITVQDDEVHLAIAELGAAGLLIGDCGAAALAALRALSADPRCAALRAAIGFGPRTEALLVATEGITGPTLSWLPGVKAGA